jgi:hypothetical protein
VAGQNGLRFTPVARERQQQAVHFLDENAFATPMFLVKPEILRRIEPNGVLGRIRTAQLRTSQGWSNRRRSTARRRIVPAICSPTCAAASGGSSAASRSRSIRTGGTCSGRTST